MHLGIAIFLGLADVVATSTTHLGQRKSYQNVFWYEVGCTGVALLILVVFMRIDNAKSDLTEDEKMGVRGSLDRYRYS
jgi:hypothetical protein